jgi:Flp pilus assembly pilin Flp
MDHTNLLRRFIFDESAQGISEYGAILAFVALLIVLLLGFAQGSVAAALQGCYNVIVSTLQTLCSQV